MSQRNNDAGCRPAPGDCNARRAGPHSLSQEHPSLPALSAQEVITMTRIFLVLAMLVMLGGCAAPVPPGVQQTRAMTDMDGRPIDPGPSGYGWGGAGFGIGGWTGGHGGGIGFGMGW